MHGPAPTPTAILEKRGSWRAKTRPNEPRPPAVRPEKPAGLKKKKEIAVWERVVPILDEMGVLAQVDVEMIADYCRLRVIFDAAYEFISENGMYMTLYNADGSVKDIKTYPQLRVMTSAHDKLFKIQQAFGMSPSSRVNVRVNPAIVTPTITDVTGKVSIEDARKKMGQEYAFFD